MLIILVLSGRCGGSLYSTSTAAVQTYEVSSVDALRAGVRCRWAIDAPRNEHVEINVTSVNIPSTLATRVDCNTDHLELRDQPLVGCTPIHYYK